jgi:hypothetical protein
MSAARDLTPLPDLLHDTPFAGPVRTRGPVYVDLLPPCNNACPAGEDIQGRETVNPFYARVPEAVQAAMDELGARAGRHSRLASYHTSA